MILARSAQCEHIARRAPAREIRVRAEKPPRVARLPDPPVAARGRRFRRLAGEPSPEPRLVDDGCGRPLRGADSATACALWMVARRRRNCRHARIGRYCALSCCRLVALPLCLRIHRRACVVAFSVPSASLSASAQSAAVMLMNEPFRLPGRLRHAGGAPEFDTSTRKTAIFGLPRKGGFNRINELLSYSRKCL